MNDNVSAPSMKYDVVVQTSLDAIAAILATCGSELEARKFAGFMELGAPCGSLVMIEAYNTQTGA